jgi:hypothetical protein
VAPVGESDHCVLLTETRPGTEQEIRSLEHNLKKGDYDNLRFIWNNGLKILMCYVMWVKLKQLLEAGIKSAYG